MEVGNLDYIASQCAQEIVKATKTTKEKETKAKTLDILATKTLGVLQEQGVYAAMLFLLSRSKEEEMVAQNIRSHLYSVLKRIPGEEITTIPSENMESDAVLECYSTITKSIDTLLLVRTLYEKILVYTRYGAKAVRKETEKEDEP